MQSPQRLTSAPFQLENARQRLQGGTQQNVSVSPQRKTMHEQFPDYFDYKQFKVPQSKQRPMTVKNTDPPTPKAFSTTCKSAQAYKQAYRSAQQSARTNKDILALQKPPDITRSIDYSQKLIVDLDQNCENSEDSFLGEPLESQNKQVDARPRTAKHSAKVVNNQDNTKYEQQQNKPSQVELLKQQINRENNQIQNLINDRQTLQNQPEIIVKNNIKQNQQQTRFQSANIQNKRPNTSKSEVSKSPTRPNTCQVRQRASLITYKQNINDNQRELFKLNIKQQQCDQVTDIHNNLMNKDVAKYNNKMNKQIASIQEFKNNIDKLQVDNELLDVKIQQAEQSIILINDQLKSEKQLSIQKEGQLLELRNSLQVGQNVDVDQLYMQYAYIDPQQIIDQIDSHEQQLIKNTIYNQNILDQKQSEIEKFNNQQLINQQIVKTEIQQLMNNKQFLEEKLFKLKQENKNLISDKEQAQQAHFKSVRLNKAIIEFKKHWNQVLDYKFVNEVGKIQDKQVFNDIQKQIFRIPVNKNGNSQKSNFIQTVQGDAYKRLSYLILKLYKEYPPKISSVEKYYQNIDENQNNNIEQPQTDDSITQNIPDICRYICETTVKQSENIIQLQKKNQILLEEQRKIQDVYEQIQRWHKRLELQLETTMMDNGVIKKIGL